MNFGRYFGPGTLGHVRASAEETGRVYAVCYDMSGMPEDRLYDTLVNDWKRLVDELGVTRDGRYLHHDGKPVLFVWGFYPDRFGAATAHRIIDFFEQDGPYGVTLVGGVPWYWRNEEDAEWATGLPPVRRDQPVERRQLHRRRTGDASPRPVPGRATWPRRGGRGWASCR